MKKLLIAGVVVGLVAGSMIPAQAAKKKKKPKPVPAPVAVDLKYYLRDENCDAENYLSLVDGPDGGCWFYDTGTYDAIVGTGLLTQDDLSQIWTTSTEGIPLTIDASKAVTGEITTRGIDCIEAPACAGSGAGGQAALDVSIRAEIDGQVVEIGKHSETFTAVPSQPHTSTLSIDIDDALDKKQATSITVAVFLHGQQMGYGAVEVEDPASFVTMPAFQ